MSRFAPVTATSTSLDQLDADRVPRPFHPNGHDIGNDHVEHVVLHPLRDSPSAPDVRQIEFGPVAECANDEPPASVSRPSFAVWAEVGWHGPPRALWQRVNFIPASVGVRMAPQRRDRQ